MQLAMNSGVGLMVSLPCSQEDLGDEKIAVALFKCTYLYIFSEHLELMDVCSVLHVHLSTDKLSGIGPSRLAGGEMLSFRKKSKLGSKIG